MRLFQTILIHTVRILASVCFIGIFLLICTVSPYLVGYQPTVVLSGSMQPSIQDGSLVYVKKIESKERLNVGDVIAFRSNEDDVPILHRIVKMEQDRERITTKGDANEAKDMNYVRFDEVKGVVQKVQIPMVGYVVEWIKQPWVMILIVGVIVVYTIVPMQSNVRKNKKEG